jgi:hypothetical protein
MKVPSATRILVVDDHPGVIDILVTCLREEGYGVFGALTGDVGLKDFILPDRPSDRGDRESGPSARSRGVSAWRTGLCRQAVRSHLPQARCRNGAPRGA